jgi:trimethylamine--corrinoid protein Co-methyltransferase
MLSTRQNFESWQESGSLDAARRANAIWKQLLAAYQRPPLDPAVEEALNDYVARRKHEIGRAA